MLIGALQGICFALILFLSKKYRTKSNISLALLILCFALNNLQYYFWETGMIDEKIFFSYIFFPFATLSMVFFYLYVRFFLNPTEKLKKKYILLFIPFLFFFASSFYYKIANALNLLTDKTIQLFKNLIWVHEIFGVFYSLVLLIFTYKLIIQFEKKQQIGKTQVPKTGVNWFKIVAWIAVILCLIWIFAILDEWKYGTENATIYYILWIGLSLTIYALGHIGIYKFGLLEERKNIQKFSTSNKAVILVSTGNSSNENIRAFEEFIKDQKNYLNSNLSLELVAEKLNINKSYLSRIINSELNISFSDYVNELRIEEAKIYLTNPEFRNYTLVSIGLEAGFNSKSAFNMAFKKFTGLTPSEYKSQLKKET